MAQRPLAVAVQFADDHVEARASGDARVGVKPGGGSPNQPGAFAGIHGLLGWPQAPPTPRLDLDEDDERAAAGDQIDLDAAGSNVACDDAITSPPQVRGCALFARGAQHQVPCVHVEPPGPGTAIR